MTCYFCEREVEHLVEVGGKFDGVVYQIAVCADCEEKTRPPGVAALFEEATDDLAG